jgi:hypothetical protein
MIDHFTFLFFLTLFLFSNIGYGLIFVNCFKKNFEDLNFGFLGLIGFFVIVILSYFSSFFVAHGYIHNIILHSIGSLSFVYFFLKKNNTREFKNILLTFLVFFIGIYVWKNHDDFGYYHLTYALNLSENKLSLGTGLLGHGFRTSSSIFFYHSTLYLPYIKYYLFHSGPFFILIYFNYIILTTLFSCYRIKKFNLVYFFYLLSFVYVNIVFYRIAEHGTDRTPQILVFLIFALFLELFHVDLKLEDKIKKFNVFIIIISLIASMKVLYILYFLLIPLIFFKNNFYKKYKLKKNYIIIVSCFLIIFFNSLNSFLSTGCFVYPAKKTCLYKKFAWSLPQTEVERMSIHYEWWAKAGGGPGYTQELDPSIYIKNFNWVSNWIERHFFNKVLDTLLGTILISLIIFLTYKNQNKILSKKGSFGLIYGFIFLLLAEWFLKHPSMRYGGYVLLALPIFLYCSNKLTKYEYNLKTKLISTFAICLISIAVYNLRNIARLNNEIKNYYSGYNLIESPFFYLPKVTSKIIFEAENFKIYSPSNSACWNSPTPCSNGSKIKAIEWRGFKIFQKSND